MRSDVPVEVAAVLQDLVAEAASVDPLLFPGLGSLHNGHAVSTHHQTAAALMGLSFSRGCVLHWGLNIWVEMESMCYSFTGLHTPELV